METVLKTNEYEEMAQVFSGTVSREFVADCIVPDTMPDAASVVESESILILRSKETEADSVILTASVSVSVLYMPEGDGKMRSLPVNVPVEMRIEAPSADADCRTVAHLRLKSVDAWAENSRKLSVRAEVEAVVLCFRKQSITIAAGISGECEQTPVHLLVREAEMIRVADVREKTFVVTDEYLLPAGMHTLESIASKRVSACVDDVKYVSGKIVFRGRTQVNLLLEGDGDNLFVAGRYETEFSQIMEVAAEGADVMPELAVALTGAYFDPPDRRQESGKIGVELHFAAQSVCRERRNFSYLADLYCNQATLVQEQRPFEYVSAVCPVSMRQTVTGRAEPFAGDDKVLGISVCVGNITVEGKTVKTVANTRLICCRNDGQYFLSRCRLNAEFTTDLPEETELCGVTVNAADAYYTAAGGGTDVRVTLQMNANAVIRRSVMCVDSMMEDSECCGTGKDAPSVTLVRIGDGEDIWTVAKKHHSTVEAIEEANGGKTSGLMLIPRAR